MNLYEDIINLAKEISQAIQSPEGKEKFDYLMLPTDHQPNYRSLYIKHSLTMLERKYLKNESEDVINKITKLFFTISQSIIYPVDECIYDLSRISFKPAHYFFEKYDKYLDNKGSEYIEKLKEIDTNLKEYVTALQDNQTLDSIKMCYEKIAELYNKVAEIGFLVKWVIRKYELDPSMDEYAKIAYKLNESHIKLMHTPLSQEFYAIKF